jgi:hypothetical protein
MLPTRFLRDLTLLTPTTTTDAYNAEVPDTWTESTITGRVDQRSRRETTTEGRQASVTEWLLLTNTEPPANTRVEDGALLFEIDGRAWPVYAGSAVHHYEASLILVEG